MTRTERAGLGFAGLEILAVGLVPAFSKFAVMRVDPLLYGAVAVTVAALVSLTIAFVRGELASIFDPAYLKWLVPIAVLGTTVTTLLLFFGARLADGVSAALLLQTEPVFSLALAWIFWRRGASRRHLLGTALVLGGIVMVLYDGTFRIGLGEVLVLLAPLGWQLSHVLALRVMPPLSPYAVTAARYLYGGAGLILVQAFVGSSPPSALGPRGLSMALFHGGILFYCGTLFWYETIRRLDLTRATAIVTPCEPVISLVLVWILLGGLPNAWQASGMALLVPGMYLVVTRSRRSRDGAEPSTDRETHPATDLAASGAGSTVGETPEEVLGGPPPL